MRSAYMMEIIARQQMEDAARAARRHAESTSSGRRRD